ncbi:YidB family protein [Serratia symbiotica]|uniref:DUF937 domain-containing protein n=1 Tax=Serratia symbiotica SCt-VLC TaxID=1347341 RepID=A0A068RAF5_9GAMM|nr:YidB family protein [Serratia symbiotica]CDG47294.1 Putative uncharacterized protein YidB [Serratia symbiotica SCt-VLC]
MGLLNSVLGNILGGASSKGIDYAAIMQWVEQQGGLQAILDKFRHGQFGDVVGSLLSNGKNQQISGDHVQQVLGSDVINQLAENWGSIRLRHAAPSQSFCLRWLTPHHPTVKCSRMATYWGIWSACVP